MRGGFGLSIYSSHQVICKTRASYWLDSLHVSYAIDFERSPDPDTGLTHNSIYASHQHFFFLFFFFCFFGGVVGGSEFGTQNWELLGKKFELTWFEWPVL